VKSKTHYAGCSKNAVNFLKVCKGYTAGQRSSIIWILVPPGVTTMKSTMAVSVKKTVFVANGANLISA